MLSSALLLAALAALGFAQDVEVPDAEPATEIRRVLLTSMVDVKFLLTASKSEAGSGVVV